MTTPIPPTQGSPLTGPASGPASGAQSARRKDAALTRAPSSEPAASLHTFPSSPPQAVLDEMANAARVHDALRAQGRELRFAHDGQSGRMSIEVRDGAGAVLRTISPAQALAVVAGKPLE